MLGINTLTSPNFFLLFLSSASPHPFHSSHSNCGLSHGSPLWVRSTPDWVLCIRDEGCLCGGWLCGRWLCGQCFMNGNRHQITQYGGACCWLLSSAVGMHWGGVEGSRLPGGLGEIALAIFFSCCQDMHVLRFRRASDGMSSDPYAFCFGFVQAVYATGRGHG